MLTIQLSMLIVQLLRDMRRQFASLLYQMGFMNSADPENPDANIHSSMRLYYLAY